MGQGTPVGTFGVFPSVHSIVEVDESEFQRHHGEVIVDLVDEAWVSGGCGGGEEVTVGAAGEKFGDLGIVAASDGIAEEQDVGEGGIGCVGLGGPGPLDFFEDALMRGGFGSLGEGRGEGEACKEEEREGAESILH